MGWRTIASAGLLASGLLACSSQPELTEEQKELRDSIVLVERLESRGVRYAVSAKPGATGVYQVRTVDRRAGNPTDIRAAVIREFGCTSIEILRHNKNWSDTEVKGAFCRGGQRIYRY